MCGRKKQMFYKVHATRTVVAAGARGSSAGSKVALRGLSLLAMIATALASFESKSDSAC
jgi:hypothetical protein